MAQSIKRPTLGFSSGHELMVCGFKPHVGLHTDSAQPAWDALSIPLSVLLLLVLSVFLKINK